MEEKIKELLNILLKNNMCSITGDALINKFLKDENIK